MNKSRLFTKNFNILISGSVVAIGLSFFAFKQLPQLFFASDELLQMGSIHFYGVFAGLTEYNVLRLLMGDHRPLGTLIGNLFQYYLGYNTLPFVLFMYGVHALNIILTGLVVDKISKNRFVSVVAMLVFAVPTTAVQTFAWLAVPVQTLSNLFFILLALYANITGNERQSRKLIILSWIFAYISFLFKETAFFVFPVLALIPWILNYKEPFIRKPAVIAGVIVALGSAAVYKIYPILTAGGTVVMKTVWYIWFYPLISLSQYFIPFRFLPRAGMYILLLIYPHALGSNITEYAGTVIVADMISIILSFCILFGLTMLFTVKREYRTTLSVIAGFYVLSFLPIAVYLSDRGSSYVESRYLYLPYFAIAVMVAILADWLRKSLALVFRWKLVPVVIVGVLIAIFLVKQITVVQREIKQNVYDQTQVRDTMTLLRNTVRTLPENPVFYITSDRD